MRHGRHDQPDRPAVITEPSGVTITYGELDDRSRRIVTLWRDRGLARGDSVAFVLENHPRFFEVVWAAQRAGLYFTPVNWHLTADEVAYILEDSGARVVVVSAATADTVRDAVDDAPAVEHRWSIDDGVDGFESLPDLVSRAVPAEELGSGEGCEMLYSSGTTGRPKAVRRPLPDTGVTELHRSSLETLRLLWGIGPDTRYLSPAPLYHSAPLVFCMNMHRIGATAVVMERFDPALCLELVERHRITVAQFVPTMFVRMLKLPVEQRTGYDLSSLETAIHAAAPCPVPVKQQMMEWWGPIIHEYYSGTEGFGSTMIGPEEWLAHPGSVGRPMTEMHVLDEHGEECQPGVPGQVYFVGGPDFEYHNDPAKTASVANEQGWRTLGDIGYVDDDGYLYLTDRATFMIVSGGVNIYPQEVENLIVTHPEVLDVAVFGVPDDEMGEAVKAVVQPLHGVPDAPAAREQLAADIAGFCRGHLAHYKCPRTVDLVAELPRDENGKLYKRRLREQYWEGHGTRIL